MLINKRALIIIVAISILIAVIVLGWSFYTRSKSTNTYQREAYKDKDWPYLNSALPVEQRVEDLLVRMTLQEKIGQMALVEKNSIKNLDDIYVYGLGAMMSGGGGYPKVNTPEEWARMVKEFTDASRKSRLGIPLLYGVDGNHGHSSVIGATIFPHAIGLGTTGNEKLVHDVAKATALEMAATNVYWNFSPSLDVPQDLRWGRVYESFGSSSPLVTRLGGAYIAGAQSSLNGRRFVATAKHYISSGSMEAGTSINKWFLVDQGNTNILESELREAHLPPFKKAVDEGVLVVMAGLNKWKSEKIVFNQYLLTDVLKKELGFEGFVVSDWFGVYEQETDQYKALVKAVNAGVDMVMLPFDYKSFISHMEKAVRRGDIKEDRINEAVRRILRVKFLTGLFDQQEGLKDFSIVGSSNHRALARQAVRESLVLLKNQNNVLPISKEATIVVGGSAADNIGQQSGGWTVEWQGIDGNWIPGTTILQGIKESASSENNIKYSAEGNFEAPPADVGIAVVGEKPYAEGWGDREHPSLSDEDIEVINKVKKASKKIVVIIISGRPLDIRGQLGDWDGVVAAWLPGSEGAGISDVLFGDYPFVGALPVNWQL